MSQKELYLAELEKYKDVVLEMGTYQMKHRGTKGKIIKYDIISVHEDHVMVKSHSNLWPSKKTLHWARKNLVRCE